MPDSCDQGEEHANFPNSGDFLYHLSDDQRPIEGTSFNIRTNEN